MARGDMERAIGAALSRKGIAGTVVIRETMAELHGLPEVVAIDLGDWVAQWDLLPPELCERRAEAAAARLVTALAAVRGDAPRRRAGHGRALGVVGLLVLGGLIFWGLRASGFFGRIADTAPVSSEIAPVEEPERAKRACEAARQRLYAGAEMGIDTEGWLVELWLARSEPGIDEAVVRAEPRAGAAVPMAVEPVEGAVGGSEVTVRFAGDDAHAFFDRGGREQFVDLAERLAVATRAARGALYARCAHLDAQDVGAWYFGGDDAAVVAVLWQTAGAHAEGGRVDLKELAPLDEKAASVARDLPEALRGVGGRREAGAAGVSLRFPFGGPTGAARLSRDLAARTRR